jgi:hypothetical protein
MSVKNCSRDVLVSRNSSQMALDEYISTNACEKFHVFSFLEYILLLPILLLIILYMK